jgi:hypothetical protein
LEGEDESFVTQNECATTLKGNKQFPETLTEDAKTKLDDLALTSI